MLIMMPQCERPSPIAGVRAVHAHHQQEPDQRTENRECGETIKACIENRNVRIGKLERDHRFNEEQYTVAIKIRSALRGNAVPCHEKAVLNHLALLGLTGAGDGLLHPQDGAIR